MLRIALSSLLVLLAIVLAIGSVRLFVIARRLGETADELDELARDVRRAIDADEGGG